MILSLFRRKASQSVVERLYGEIVAASRLPALYRPPYGVTDTVEGRFEILTLHAFLALRRLSALPAPAPDLAQDLANRIFQDFDAALRAMGVGDLTVPKRMKTLAENFGGRNAAYAAALQAGGALETALARNIYGLDEPDAAVAALARYVRAAAAAIEAAPFAAFEEGPVPFPPLEVSP